MTKIDTSGAVGERKWSDLTPFAQGYIEALFGSVTVDTLGATYAERPALCPAFSDLAPETLARIITDCEAWFSGWVQHPNNAAVRKDDRTEGGRFWAYRQASEMTQFPPLTVHLGEDGKVRLA